MKKNTQLKKFVATINLKKQIIAEDEDEAREIFWQDWTEGNTTPENEIDEILKIKEIK